MKNKNSKVLHSLLIKNFKSIGNQEKIDFGNLTLLCGENSSGKSTIINTLLLLAQSGHHFYQQPDTSFPLNGVVQQLGSIENIKNKSNDRMVLTTQKDFVRLSPKFNSDLLFFLPIEMEIEEEKQKALDALVANKLGID